MKIYKKFYNIPSSVVLFTLSILGIATMVVPPFLQPLNDTITIVSYIIIVLSFTAGTSYLLHKVFWKTFVVIIIGEEGVTRKTIFGSELYLWDNFSEFTKGFVPDYFSGFSEGYVLKGTKDEVHIPKNEILDDFLSSHLDNYSNHLYLQYIEVKDIKITQH